MFRVKPEIIMSNIGSPESTDSFMEEVRELDNRFDDLIRQADTLITELNRQSVALSEIENNPMDYGYESDTYSDVVSMRTPALSPTYLEPSSPVYQSPPNRRIVRIDSDVSLIPSGILFVNNRRESADTEIYNHENTGYDGYVDWYYYGSDDENETVVDEWEYIDDSDLCFTGE